MPDLDTVRLARLATALADSKTALAARGVTVPSGALLDDIPGLIAQVPTGGGDTPLSVTANQAKFRVNLTDTAQLRATVGYTQSIANDVVVDFGDNSQTATAGGANAYIEHTFPSVGKYVVTLTAQSGTLTLPGVTTNIARSMLFTDYLEHGYGFNNIALLSCVEEIAFGSSVQFATHCFDRLAVKSVSMPTGATKAYCPGSVRTLKSFTFAGTETSFDGNFAGCTSLVRLNVPSGITSIPASFAQDCYSLQEVTLLGEITDVAAFAFNGCYGVRFYDFSHCTAVPTLANANAFTRIPSFCRIIVPDALVATWKAATNWATYADNIISVTEANAA